MSKQNRGESEYAVDFVFDILEKMTDNQSLLVEKLLIIESHCGNFEQKTNFIQNQFTNGFRSEIKDHTTNIVNESNEIITTSMTNLGYSLASIQSLVNDLSNIVRLQTEQIKKGLEGSSKEILNEVKSYRKIGFWVKIIAAILVSAAGISFAAATFANALRSDNISGFQKNIVLLDKNLIELKNLLDKHIATKSGE